MTHITIHFCSFFLGQRTSRAFSRLLRVASRLRFDVFLPPRRPNSCMTFLIVSSFMRPFLLHRQAALAGYVGLCFAVDRESSVFRGAHRLDHCHTLVITDNAQRVDNLGVALRAAFHAITARLGGSNQCAVEHFVCVRHSEGILQ